MDKSFSLKERLIIANQYDILSKLAEDEYEKKQYENLREIFVSGYTRYYSLATELFSEELNESDCKFVVDVLNLYRDLYFSWEHNNEAKETIEESEVLFKGFDLNDPIEGSYYSFAQFLIEDLGRFEEIKEFIEEGKIESLNSHGFGPSMETLSNMIAKRKEIKERYGHNPPIHLTTEEIKEILNV